RRAQRPRPRAGRDGRARGQGERRARPGGVRMADGVGSTEPPRSGGAGFAGAGAGSGVGSTEPPRSGAGISVDPVTFEVIRNALVAATDEMALALKRSAYSTNIKTRS